MELPGDPLGSPTKSPLAPVQVCYIDAFAVMVFFTPREASDTLDALESGLADSGLRLARSSADETTRLVGSRFETKFWKLTAAALEAFSVSGTT